MTPLNITLTLILSSFSIFVGAASPADSVQFIIGQRLKSEGGKESGTPSPLQAPFGIDFDRQGVMWIVELEGARVQLRGLSGKVLHVSGNGKKGYEGDGGLAKGAVFNGMHNVAIAADDGVLIADSWNHCIRRIDPKTGKVSTFAGGKGPGFSGDLGPAKDAIFNFVMCIAFDPKKENLYLADLRNRRIRAIDMKTGIVRTIAGNGKKGVPENGSLAADSPLVDPRAVAADSRGRVYVLERGGHALRRIDADGKIYTVAGTGKGGYRDGPALEAQLRGPKHLTVGDSDIVYIADDQNRAIRKYDPETKTLTTVLGSGKGPRDIRLSRPHGVSFYKGGLYVVDTGHHRVLRLEP